MPELLFNQIFVNKVIQNNVENLNRIFIEFSDPAPAILDPLKLHQSYKKCRSKKAI